MGLYVVELPNGEKKNVNGAYIVGEASALEFGAAVARTQGQDEGAEKIVVKDSRRFADALPPARDMSEASAPAREVSEAPAARQTPTAAAPEPFSEVLPDAQNATAPAVSPEEQAAWDKATITVTYKLMPHDGDAAGRKVLLLVSAEGNASPYTKLCRESELAAQIEAGAGSVRASIAAAPAAKAEASTEAPTPPAAPAKKKPAKKSASKKAAAKTSKGKRK